jgi:hypothetical protein
MFSVRRWFFGILRRFLARELFVDASLRWRRKISLFQCVFGEVICSFQLETIAIVNISNISLLCYVCKNMWDLKIEAILINY